MVEADGLRWLEADFLSKVVTIGKDMNGRTLSVPFNSATEAVLLEMGTQRTRPNDPHEPVFPRRLPRARQVLSQSRPACPGRSAGGWSG